MPSFNKNFGFKTSPFEQYVAENEPNIDDYAVKPPYFEETVERTVARSSFILFGFRGSGKSATRITTAKEIWKLRGEGQTVPLIVTLTDFHPIIGNSAIELINASTILRHVAFLTIEALLLWLSDQDKHEQLIETLSGEEKNVFIDVVRTFYLCVPESKRKVRETEAMKVLHQTWINRSNMWVSKRWQNISSVVASIVSALSKKHLSTESMKGDIEALLSGADELSEGIIILDRLVECARLFGFSGVCIFVDKVDEHTKTQDFAEKTARLIHPILSQVQLMEVENLGWIYFLWDKVKSYCSEEKLLVRLDKLAHCNVKWSEQFLSDMIKKRVKHFSNGKITNLQSVCDKTVDFSAKLSEMIGLVQSSPRELIRLMDVIIREYNATHGEKAKKVLLSVKDIEHGEDIYIKDRLWTIYNNKILSQILRLGLPTFTNKDVQTAFRISVQGARNRIRNWEVSGAVKLSGTISSSSDAGGAPSNQYSIADPRILRMLERRLFDAEVLTEVAMGEDEASG